MDNPISAYTGAVLKFIFHTFAGRSTYKTNPPPPAMKIKEGFTGQRSITIPRVVVRMMEADPMTTPLHITEMGHYPRAMHHWRTRTDPIGQCVLIYCTDGAGWFETEGRRRTVRTGSFFILPPGVPHAYGADPVSPWTIYWVHFEGTLAAAYAALAAEPVVIDPAPDSRIASRNALFEEILTTLTRSLTRESLRYAMGAFAHWLASMVFVSEYRSAGKEQRPAPDDIVSQTVHYLRENIERRLTVSDVARFAGFSPTYLSAIFRERTGHSLMGYFNLMKVRQACRMLDDTDMQINQISYKLGIPDPFYFSRMFTKIMGQSPRAYRTRPAGA